ncbi:MAG: hypothetical protein LBK62_13535 [Treponema sp.]|jgi:hypothetical protein|nr:hypothetical protein [Treponema sp.]
MKKFLMVMAICIVVCEGVFAESGFSFYGRGVFTPIALSGEDSAVSAATTTYDNQSRPRIGFTLNANNVNQTIGISAVFNWDGKTGNADSLIGENAYIWVKPLGPFESLRIADMLKLTIGRFEVDDFRGRVGTAEFQGWILPEGSKDEDAIFMRFKASAGAHITLKPLSWWDSPWNAFSIEGAVGSNLSGERAIRNIVGWTAADVYKAMQIGFSYEIPKTGLVRLQLIGNNRKVRLEDYPKRGEYLDTNLTEGLSTSTDSDVIEAAFLFDGIENLKVDAGAKIPLPFTTNFPYYEYYRGIYYGSYPYETSNVMANNHLEVQQPYSAALGATYKWNNLDTLLRFDFSFGGKYVDEGIRTVTIGSDMRFFASLGYRFLPPLRVGLDIGYNHHDADMVEESGTTDTIGERPNDQFKTARDDFGFAPWLAIDLGGGVVKTGIAIMFPSTPLWTYTKDGTATQIFSGEPVISIPISVTYSF